MLEILSHLIATVVLYSSLIVVVVAGVRILYLMEVQKDNQREYNKSKAREESE
jgi:hypothetical protein